MHWRLLWRHLPEAVCQYVDMGCTCFSEKGHEQGFLDGRGDVIPVVLCCKQAHSREAAEQASVSHQVVTSLLFTSIKTFWAVRAAEGRGSSER